MTAAEPKTSKQKLRRDMAIAASCGVFVATMVGAAYASVPFYNWFCRTTGFAGTPQISEKAPDHILGRTVTVRFDSNVTAGLPWKFVPEPVAPRPPFLPVISIACTLATQRLTDSAPRCLRRVLTMPGDTRK